MRLRWWLAGALLLSFGIAPHPANAQRRDSTTTTTDSARAVALAPIVVTASAVPVRADRIGVPVSVLNAVALRERRARNAADALRFVDGAFLDEAAGPGGPTIVRLRGGEEVFTQILVDGVRINQNGGFFDFQGFTLGNVDRVEIARGPQSALYGSSAVSGVVQFFTQAGVAGPPRLSLAAEGSADTDNGSGYRTSAALSGGTDRVRYSTSLGWTYERGIYALPHDTKTAEASLRVDASPSERFDLTGTLRFTGVDAMLPVRDAGATRVPLDPNARSARDRLLSSIVARIGPGGRVRHELRASAYREDFTYIDERDDVAEQVSVPFFIFDADFRLDSRLWRTGVEYAGTYEGGGARTPVAFSWGARWEREDLRDETSGEFGAGTQQLDRNSGAAFGELLISPAPWLHLVAGARVEKYEEISAAFTPRASAVVDLSPILGTAQRRLLSLRLAAGRAFKAPNLQEQFLDNPFIVSNPDLEPETSTSWEAGLDARLAGGDLNASLTWFRQRFQDLIRSVAIGDGSQQQNRNLGASRASGIEWSLAARIADPLTIGTSGAWVRTRILDASGLPESSFPVGAELPFRPAVVGTVYADFAPAGWPLRINARAQHVGEQTVLSERFSGERVVIDAYTLAGLTLNWDVTRGWSAWARFDNLLDSEYETAFDRRGSPATAALGLQWRN